LKSVENLNGWTYETFDRNTPASDFGIFGSLITLWKSKWVSDALPAWRDFTFEDFAGWYGWLYVEDLIPGGNGDARYRLWGTNITNIFQVDLTGKCMSETEPGFIDPVEYKLNMKNAEEGNILHGTGPIHWQERLHKTVAFIELPLADDGFNVDKFLGGLRDITPDAQGDSSFR